MEKKQTKGKEVECRDKNCPIHNNLSTRGKVFDGTIIADKMQGTVCVEWPRLYYISKYERYEKRRTRVKAHLPKCINAVKGDMVRIAECRPLGKTVSFVVIEKLKGEK